MEYRSTSREAYHRLHEISGHLDNEIMRALRAHPNGITCQAIEDYIGRDHQAVSGNLRHLVERGFAMASGRFGYTRSGRRAILWVVAAAPAAQPPAPPAGPPGQLDLL